MSHTHQDETSSQRQLTAPPTAPRVSQIALTSESTPATKKHGPDLLYTSIEKDLEEIRHDLTKEMEGRWLGAMPVDKFLAKYLPVGEDSKLLPNLPDNLFENVPRDGVESQRYNYFVGTLSS